MDVNEKAQRLALVTDVKFRLDNKTGEIVQSEQVIPKEVIDQAMNMSDEEYQQKKESLRRKNEALMRKTDISSMAAFMAYKAVNPDAVYEEFLLEAVNEVEKLKN